MKTFKILICALAVGLGAAASGSALAHGRVHFGFHFGGPFWGYPAPYYYYPAPVYYYPPPVVYQQAPTYIERPANEAPVPQSSPPQSATENSWYFCRETQAYYPYVKECVSPWQRVSPRPPGS